MNVPVKKLTTDARMPTYGSEDAAGFDLYAAEEVTIEPGEAIIVKLGLAFAIPKGYEIQIRPRSGISRKSKLRIPNAPGTIDADYRGEVGIPLDNISHLSEDKVNTVLTIQGEKENCVTFHPEGTYIIHKHDRIAQGILKEVPRAVFSEVESLEETRRGLGGFGSTGIR
nr:dUTP diphosphatase [Natribacillus halophilus]